MLNKKTSIYTAVLKLMNDNNGTTDITISQIAASAGIGKGTVYEYFSSKDEIFKETFLWFIEGFIEKIKIHDCSMDFKDQLYCLLRGITAAVSDNCVIFQSIFLNFSTHKMSNISEELRNRIIKIYTEVTDMLSQICNKGVEEGLIKPEFTDFDLYFAFVSVASFCNGVSSMSDGLDIFEQPLSELDLLKFCYEKFIKLLG